MKNSLKLFAFTCLIALSLQASAHYIWIELAAPVALNKEQEVRIYYGEFNEGVREVKGGRLEELDGIQAWLISPDGAKTNLTVTTDSKFFKTTFTPKLEGKYVILAVNTVREVVDWSKYDLGIVRPVYYTTKEIIVGSVQPNAFTTLPDVAALSVSSAAEKNSYRVSFKGKPLSKVKVLFHAPNEWSKELSTDADGKVSFDPLWKGQYIIECIYPEKTPGTFKGKNYEVIRHRATLTIDIP